MLEVKTELDTIESAEIFVEKFEEKDTNNVIDKYIQKVKAKDVEQIKIYLGVIYFFALTFLSITLLM